MANRSGGGFGNKGGRWGVHKGGFRGRENSKPTHARFGSRSNGYTNGNCKYTVWFVSVVTFSWWKKLAENRDGVQTTICTPLRRTDRGVETLRSATLTCVVVMVCFFFVSAYWSTKFSGILLNYWSNLFIADMKSMTFVIIVHFTLTSRIFKQYSSNAFRIGGGMRTVYGKGKKKNCPCSCIS